MHRHTHSPVYHAFAVKVDSTRRPLRGPPALLLLLLLLPPHHPASHAAAISALSCACAVGTSTCRAAAAADVTTPGGDPADQTSLERSSRGERSGRSAPATSAAMDRTTASGASAWMLNHGSAPRMLARCTMLSTGTARPW